MFFLFSHGCFLFYPFYQLLFVYTCFTSLISYIFYSQLVPNIETKKGTNLIKREILNSVDNLPHMRREGWGAACFVMGEGEESSGLMGGGEVSSGLKYLVERLQLSPASSQMEV